MIDVRLIDADAFKEYIRGACEEMSHVYKDGGKWAKQITEDFCMDIDEQPTIEPERKKGRWIERNPQNSDKCRLIECDQCGFSHIVGFNVPYEHWIENRNFCERCGADMRGEQE